MKQRLLFLWSLLTVLTISSCSDRKNDQELPDNGVKGEFTVSFAFEGTAGTKAPAKSTAIPETSWSKIKQMQILIYNAAKKVIFSDVFVPGSPGAVLTKTYTSIPVGNNYTVAVVANAKQSTENVQTFLQGIAGSVEWGNFNVRQKDAGQMLIKHKPGTFPSFVSLPGKTAYKEPAEIFMGYATGVNISAGNTATAGPIALKREVSLMRVRVNVTDSDPGVNNGSTGSDGIDFTNDASILVYRLPNEMKILAGNDGGIGAASTATNILSVYEGTVFNTQDPTQGYNPKKIIEGNFKMWKDIVVFPNDQRSTASAAGNANADRQYFIVISGKGKVGHVLADGTKLTSPKTVYWSGTIREKFIPNQIREVNLTLRTGGTTTIPEQPTVEGGLTIKVSTPTAWDSNIVQSNEIL